MKDYEITIKLQVQASDSISQDDVLSEIMSHVSLTPTLIDADKDISVNDLYKNIICLNVLSDGSGDGYEKYDELVNFLKRENAHTEYVNERLRKMTAAMGMSDDDYKDKPKTKRQGQPKATLKDIDSVWKKCTVNDNVLHLSEQLDRKIYDEVKKQLEAVGGMWKSGKIQGFVFSDTTDANDVLRQLLSGKDYLQEKKDFQFFATPKAVADEVAQHLGRIKDNAKILEPSAGQGALIKAVQRINDNVKFDVYEAMQENKKVLQTMQHVNIVGDDFLQSDLSVKYDYIIANPPFSKNQDITHVLRMYEHLSDGGRLVAIMSPHWQHAQDKKSKQFRDFLQSVSGQTFEIAEGAFKQSGTNIRTYYVVIDKASKDKQTVKSNALF